MDLKNLSELKKQARALSFTQLEAAFGVLQGVLNDRQKEAETLASIREFASSKGFSLEQLGYTMTDAVASESVKTERSNKSKDKRPAKPKLLGINMQNQLFYIQDGALLRVDNNLMKARFSRTGQQMLTFASLDKQQKKVASALVDEARKVATLAYNNKLDAWNTWAAAHDEEILSPK